MRDHGSKELLIGGKALHICKNLQIEYIINLMEKESPKQSQKIQLFELIIDLTNDKHQWITNGMHLLLRLFE